MAATEEAVQEIVVFLDHFADLRDPRQLSEVIYPLDEILLLGLLGVLAGAETFTAIAQFGKTKLLLRRFRLFANGTPDHDRLGEVFAALDPEQFQKCFVAWVATLTGTPADVIAIDGKTSRRAYQKKGRVDPIHMVSAFAARQRLVLGQVKVAEKSNEIVAKKADYVLALKGNQGRLREGVELFANEQKARNFKDTTISQDKTVDGDHGRIETRRTFHDVGWLQERHNWPALNGVVMVQSERKLGAKVKRETRFYITSSTDKADKLGDVVRRHWAVESMHWLMHCLFRDDECRIRTEHAPANFTTIKPND